MRRRKRYARCNRKGPQVVSNLGVLPAFAPPASLSVVAVIQFVEELKTRLAHPGVGASKSFASTGDLQRAAAANGGGGGGLGGVGAIPLQGELGGSVWPHCTSTSQGQVRNPASNIVCT